ncbi:MAG: hypothetical protein U0736_08075 [Gemmataceae bacterium]
MQPANPTDNESVLTPERREVQRISSVLKKNTLTLGDYYALGEQMRKLAEDAAVTRRGSNWRLKLAAQVGCSPSTLTKSLQFRQAYEKEDLAKLEELGVGWSRLTVSLAVRNRKQRHQLLKRAKDEGWGDRELQRAIQQLRGSRRGGGRPRKEQRTQGLLADLFEMMRYTRLWQDFHDQVTAKAQGDYPAQAKELDEAAIESLRRILTDASTRLKDLRKQSQDTRTVIEELLAQLPPPPAPEKAEKPGGGRPR